MIPKVYYYQHYHLEIHQSKLYWFKLRLKLDVYWTKCNGPSCMYETWYIIPMAYYTKFTNPTMHLSHIPQCTIQNRNVHISVVNGVLWDMEQVHCGIYEVGLFCHHSANMSWYTNNAGPSAGLLLNKNLDMIYLFPWLLKSWSLTMKRS